MAHSLRTRGRPGTRAFGSTWEPLKLPEVKAVSWALGCSINDVLLSCAAGAMRRYLADKGDRTEGVQIRALAPIDLREPAGVAQWAMLSAAIAAGLGTVGAGIAVAAVGAAAVGVLAEKPDLLGRVLIFVGLAEGIAIYGLIVAILVLNRAG
jgi:F0F1-type ATP synthase membrane subunit c/vacuolar-type H+-ATPase subunit K